MKFACRSTPNSPLSSPGAAPDRLPGRGCIASMPGRMSIRSRLTPTCPVATALAALCLALDPGGRIAINPDLDPIRPDRRFEPLLEDWVVPHDDGTFFRAFRSERRGERATRRGHPGPSIAPPSRQLTTSQSELLGDSIPVPTDPPCRDNAAIADFYPAAAERPSGHPRAAYVLGSRPRRPAGRVPALPYPPPRHQQCIGDHGHRAMPGLGQPLARRGGRPRLELRARIRRRFQDPRHEENGRRGVGLGV